MFRKSMCILLVFFILSGCSGQYTRNTFTIVPASEEDLQGFNEVSYGKDARLLRFGEEVASVKDLQATPDSTSYLLRKPWRSSTGSYDDSFTEFTVPTADIRSVTICTEKHATKYILVGAGIGSVFSAWFLYKYFSAVFGGFGETNGHYTFRLSHLFLGLPGAVLGAIVGMYVGETEAVWDEYRFDRGP